MGRDPMSVVDGALKVYGIENLRIADGSIMPRVMTGNTMAGCIIIGERAGEIASRTQDLKVVLYEFTLLYSEYGLFFTPIPTTKT
jgi:choline dehydrogenase